MVVVKLIGFGRLNGMLSVFSSVLLELVNGSIDGMFLYMFLLR